MMQKPEPLNIEDLEKLMAAIQSHFDRTATLNNRASVRIARVQGIVRELDQNLLPNAILQAQYGVMNQEFGEHLSKKFAEFVEDVNELGETIGGIAGEYNELWTELQTLIQRIKESKT